MLAITEVGGAARSTPGDHLALALLGMVSAPLLIHTQMIYLRIFSSQPGIGRVITATLIRVIWPGISDVARAVWG